jgi:hypothetical protein
MSVFLKENRWHKWPSAFVQKTFPPRSESTSPVAGFL